MTFRQAPGAATRAELIDTIGGGHHLPQQDRIPANEYVPEVRLVAVTASQSAVAVVGAGNMGGCLLTGLLAAGVSASRLTAIDLRPELLAPLAQQGVATATELAAVAGADIVVVALKPQVAPKVLPSLAANLTSGQVVVSVMAGMMTSQLEAHLPAGQPVVRVMPQTLPG